VGPNIVTRIFLRRKGFGGRDLEEKCQMVVEMEIEVMYL
jgi:hypothetical protein